MYSKELETTWYQNLEKLQKLITRFSYVVIIPHANADPDSLASSCTIAYLLRELNKDIHITVAIPEGVGLECKKLLEVCIKNGINIVMIKKNVADIIKDNSLCFLIDIASLEQIKTLKNYINYCSGIVIIDHHALHDYKSIPVHIENILQFIRLDVSSASEIVFDIVKYFGITLPEEFLEMLMAGILWDTKQFTRTTSATFRYASEMLELGADYQKSRYFISIARPPYVKLAKIKCVLRHRAFKITLDQNEIFIAISEVGAYESDCASALISIGYDIAFVVSEEELMNATRIIYRVREDPSIIQKVDAYNDVLRHLVQRYGGGGGGHKSAGGAIVNIPSVDVALKKLVEVLSNLAGGKIVELEERKIFEGD